ncbi:hypothetical protein BOTCAL_0311g00050 [Botryotinia calthae]|uniref:Dynamin stalk domain-containing protein n=1 Tax=Botryotinia calthae TaxID=38488 RepID=A0A4Y8CWA5_9HELO|nr:hypothetical protein BOTCAL_0311g00050 [Botryotinia calthae]
MIEDAKAAMDFHESGRTFSKYLSRVEMLALDRPHLTRVDLPELIHSETKQRSALNIEMVQSIVQSYMKEPRGIILALARAADRGGSRTLGVITKPDTLAKNQDAKLSLEWHALKHMGSEIRTWSLSRCDFENEEFI